MTKIENLTEAQASRLPAFRREYYLHGTSTAPADRERAEAAFARAYRKIGKEPVPVIWVSSPLSASVLFAVLQNSSLRESLRESLHASLRASLHASLRASLRASLHASLRASLDASLYASLIASLRKSLHASLGASLDASLHESLHASLRASLGASLHESLRASLHASLGASLDASLGASLDASLHESLRASLRASLGASLHASLCASLHAGLEASLYASLHESLRASLYASLHASLYASLRASLYASLHARLRDSKVEPQYTYWWGQQDMSWIAFYKFCSEIGVKYNPDSAAKLDIMHDIGMSCMWWYPRDGLIIACDRPERLHTDERERLHNDAGPAISFRDGWKIYAVHGVRVPAWIFEEPHRLTVKAIDAEENSEVQRVMIERFGWDRYAEECGAKIVDHDERWGTLMRRETKGGETVLFLRVVNRTPEPDGSFRKYVLPVDAELRPIPDPARPGEGFGAPQQATALNAVASTFGMRGEEYAAMIGAES